LISVPIQLNPLQYRILGCNNSDKEEHKVGEYTLPHKIYNII